MSEQRRFPIQAPYGRQADGRMGYSGPQSIPWALIAPHERQAQANHGGQTLEELAQRMGLCACEAMAVLEDRPWRKYENHASAEQALIRAAKDFIAASRADGAS